MDLFWDDEDLHVTHQHELIVTTMAKLPWYLSTSCLRLLPSRKCVFLDSSCIYIYIYIIIIAYIELYIERQIMTLHFEHGPYHQPPLIHWQRAKVSHPIHPSPYRWYDRRHGALVNHLKWLVWITERWFVCGSRYFKVVPLSFCLSV